MPQNLGISTSYFATRVFPDLIPKHSAEVKEGEIIREVKLVEKNLKSC